MIEGRRISLTLLNYDNLNISLTIVPHFNARPIIHHNLVKKQSLRRVVSLQSNSFIYKLGTEFTGIKRYDINETSFVFIMQCLI